MKKKTILYIAIAIFSCLSCSKPTASNTEVINVEFKNNSKCDDIVSKIEVLPLDSTKKAYMSSINRCVINNDYSFFVDNRDLMFLFDKEGHLLTNSENVKGQGNGEYNICLCASYNKYSRNFEIVTPNGMKIYDSKFKYLKTVHFAADNEGVGKNRSFFNYIYDIDATHHLLMTSNIAHDPAHIYLFDSENGKFTKDVKPATAPFGISMQENYISDSDFMAMPWLSYTFYDIDLKDMTLRECIKLDLGNNEVTEKEVADLGNDERKKAEFFMKCDKPLPVRTFKSGDQIVSMLKCGMSRKDFKVLLVDLKSKSTTVADMCGKNFTMPFIENFVDGVVYAYATDDEIEKYVDGNLLDEKSKEAVKRMPRNGSTVILKYHIKKK